MPFWARTGPASRRWSRSSTVRFSRRKDSLGGAARTSPSPTRRRRGGSGSAWSSSTSRCSRRSPSQRTSRSPFPGGSILRVLAERIARVSAQYGLPLQPTALVADLSVGERQRIEIVRCLLQEPQPADHGRADRGADPAGGRPALRDAAPARRRRLRGALHLPSARGGEAALPRRHHPAPRQGGRERRSAGRDSGFAGAADGGLRRPHGER